MNKFDRLCDLHRILAGRRTAISTRDLMQKLECSEPTVRRLVAKPRDELGAPVRFGRARGGWVHEGDNADSGYELPGLWFSASELQALLACHSRYGSGRINGIAALVAVARARALPDGRYGTG